MDRVAEDAAVDQRRGVGANDEYLHQRGHPFPSDRHPCGVVVVDGAAENDGGGDDDVTDGPVAREYRSRASKKETIEK